MRGKTYNQNAATTFWRLGAFLVDWDWAWCYTPASSPTYRGFDSSGPIIVWSARGFELPSRLGILEGAAGFEAFLSIMEACGLISGMTSSDFLDAYRLPLYSTQRGSAAVRMARFPTVFPVGAASSSGCNHDELNQAIATRRPGSFGRGRSFEHRPTPLTEAS